MVYFYWFCLSGTRMPEDTVKENFHTSGSSIFGKCPVIPCSLILSSHCCFVYPVSTCTVTSAIPVYTGIGPGQVHIELPVFGIVFRIQDRIIGGQDAGISFGPKCDTDLLIDLLHAGDRYVSIPLTIELNVVVSRWYAQIVFFAALAGYQCQIIYFTNVRCI